MWNLLFAAALLAAPPNVSVETLDGQIVEGRLVSIAAESVVVETAEGQRQTLSNNTLLAVRYNHPADPATMDDPPVSSKAPPAATLSLVDGGSIPLNRYEQRGPESQLLLDGGESLTLNTEMIDEVRFGQFSDALEELWAQFRARDVAGDLVVIRTADAADVLDGVIRSVNETAVVVEFNRREVSVPRQRVLGLVFYHANRPELPGAIFTVSTTSGMRLAAGSANLRDDVLVFVTPAGLEFRLSPEQIVALDFSRGNVELLSNLTPREATWTPYFSLSQDTARRTAGFGALRRNESLEGGPLRLAGQSHATGLAMRSGTRVTYRLPGQFRELTATAGIDDRMNGRGHVVLTIQGDGRELWTGAISGAAEPVSIQADVQGVRELTLVVDYGKDLDIADHLDLVDARITK